MTILMDGREVVEKEIIKLKRDCKDVDLAIVRVGNDEASKVYVRNKERLCEEIGIKSHVLVLEEDISENQLLFYITMLNNDKNINGIIVQLPLPKHINENRIAQAIHKDKDVDCFNNFNIGAMVRGESKFSPCTPKGIFTMLNHYGFNDFRGRRVVIVGRSNIVGKPLLNMFINEGATVVSCNSNTPIDEIVKYMFGCDIFISAIGKPKYFNKKLLESIKGEFAYICDVMIDVGINRDENNKLCGDISEDLREFVNFITPVPNGVGRTTVLELMRNVVNSKGEKNDK